ncbi:MAG TPA: ABC transporter permease subunit [Thermomicrobiales bacterium]
MTQTIEAWLWLLRRARTGLLSLLVGIAVFELIQPVAIASFGNLDRMDAIVRLVPPAFYSLMNVTPDFLQAAGLAGYLALGFTHPIYHLLAAATMVWFACRSLAGEMERGSIQLALARPISRPRLYLARVGGLAAVVIGIAIVGPLGMIAGVAIADPAGSVDYRHFVPMGIMAALLAWAIGGIALGGAAAADRMGQAVGWAIAILVVSYVIDYFAALWSALRPLEPFSIFTYYDPPAALARGEVDPRNAAVLAAVGLVGAAVGLVIFSRRDLPT